MLVRHDIAGTVVRVGARDAGVGHRVIARITLQVPRHAPAEHPVHSTGLRQRQLHQLDRVRTLQDRLVGQDENALDLPLHFRLEVERQVGSRLRMHRAGRPEGQQRNRQHDTPLSVD
jgi:hypothetical protein